MGAYEYISNLDKWLEQIDEHEYLSVTTRT